MISWEAGRDQRSASDRLWTMVSAPGVRSRILATMADFSETVALARRFLKCSSFCRRCRRRLISLVRSLLPIATPFTQTAHRRSVRPWISSGNLPHHRPSRTATRQTASSITNAGERQRTASGTLAGVVSFGERGYTVGVARSVRGTIEGPHSVFDLQPNSPWLWEHVDALGRIQRLRSIDGVGRQTSQPPAQEHLRRIVNVIVDSREPEGPRRCTGLP